MKYWILGALLVLFFSSCNDKETVDVNVDLFEEVIELMLAEASVENDLLILQVRNVKYELMEPWKAKRAPVNRINQQVDENRIVVSAFMDSLTTKIRTKDKVTNLEIAALKGVFVDRLTLLDSVTHDVFMGSGDVLDYRLDHAEELLKPLKRGLKKFRVLVEDRNSNFKDDTNRALEVLALYTRYYQVQRDYVDLLNRLTFGTTADSFTDYFPVIINQNTGCLTAGDSLSIKVGIGSYYTGIDHRNSRIIIDGDTLDMNREGTATYKRLVDVAGIHELELECQIYSPLTGDVDYGEGTFQYKVYQ